MNLKRIGRLLVCLVLVACLIVNISPVKAHAVDALTVVGISAGLAITTGLIGLGLQAGGTSKALQEISGSAVSAIESGQFGEFISDGMVNAVKYNRGDGKYGFALSLGLLEALKTWIFGEGIVSSSSAGTSYTIINPLDGATTYIYSSDVPFSYCWFYYTSKSSQYVCRMLVSQEKCTVNQKNSAYPSSAGSNIPLSSYRSGYYIAGLTASRSNYDMSAAGGIYLGEITRSSYEEWAYATPKIEDEFDYACQFLSGQFGFVSTPTSAYDVTLGDVGTEDQTVEEAHSDWVAGSITVPGSLVGSDTEEKYVPVGLPADQIEALGKTQEEVQSGVGTYDDTLADTETDSDAVTGTGTIADVITEIKALPQKIADVLADVIAGVKAIPQVISEALAKAFAISDTFIATKVEALTLKYPYLDTFLALGTDLKAYFLSLGTQPPIIYIDLGAARGSLLWGGEMAFIDLTWYAEYKPKTDAIVGGFIWLWLAWRVFLSLPGLIQGGSGFWGSRSGSDESPTLYDRLPPGRG